MNCPICDRSPADSELECACGEPLTPWRTIAWAGQTVRQRGLTQAQEKDYLGACLSFFQAALTNPLDRASLVDAARVLHFLGRDEDALRWLRHAATRAPTEAAAVAETIQL